MRKRFHAQPTGLARAVAVLVLAVNVQVVSAQTFSFDIPAQPLSQALSTFARQTGLQLAYSPELVQGKQAPAIRGSHDLGQALAELLSQSGLQGRVQGRTLTLEPRPAIREGSATLPEVEVRADREPQGVLSLTRSQINAMPAGNGDITSLLKIHPNVQFSNTQQSTSTQGEIAPADISINGGKFYDNLYLMDGMSINNNMNPAGAGSAINTPPSAAQGFAIDTAFLCNVTVLDSNVSAAFGKFGGGVVSADTCAPTRKFGADVSVETTRSTWMQYKYAPGDAANAALSASAAAQPDFTKWTYRISMEGKPTENTGLIASVVRKTSEIPLRGYTNGSVSGSDDNTKTQTREQESYYLRGFWKPAAGIETDLAVTHDPYESRYFIQNARGSYFDNTSGGQSVNAGLKHTIGDGLTLSHRFVVSEMDSSRYSPENIWKAWRYSADKNWGVASSATVRNSFEGGYGSIAQTEDRLSYQMKAEVAPRQWLGLEHRLEAGLGIEHERYEYNRLNTYEQYTTSTNTTTCNMVGGGVDTEFCSLATPWNAASGGQYLRSRIIYKAGSFSVSNQSVSAYLQDEIRLDRLRVRLGLRYDKDELSPESSLAPRMAAFWDLSGNGDTRIEAGANRYYSRNFMIYQTYRERLALQSSSQTRSIVGGLIGNWAAPVFGSTASMYHVGDLKVPYSDEATLGVSHAAWGAVWGAKYVRRKARDQVVLHLRGIGDYWWDNVGYSDSDTVSLTMSTPQPIKWAGTSTFINAALDHTSVKTSHADYSDTLSSYAGELSEVISYNGQFIPYTARPADNYNRPWTARVMFITQIPSSRLTVTNLLRVRDSYEKVAATGEQVSYQGTMVDVWKTTRFRKAVTWDVQFNWSILTHADQSAYVNLGIENLFNRSNVIEGSGTTATYEKGRQVWLRVGYRF